MVIKVKKTIFNSLWALTAVFLFIYCLLNSESVAENSRLYLKLCGERVIPSLFVFSALSAIICGSGAFYKLCSLLPFFGTEAALIVMGALGGFPLGATVAHGLYDEGRITKKQAEYLCAFTNNPSLSFTVSYVGGVLGDRRLGAALAALCFLSATLSAVVLRYVFLEKEERSITLYAGLTKGKGVAEAIREGSVTMVVISGCIVFFGGICPLFPKAIRGFLELSGGIANCQTATEAAVLLGFSGLSVTCQVAAACKGRLSVFPFVISKVLQSAVMGVAAYFLFDFRG